MSLATDRLAQRPGPRIANLTLTCLFLGLWLGSPCLRAQEFPPWGADEEQILEALEHGELVSREPIGHGVTKPDRVVLRYEGRDYQAAWKTVQKDERDKPSESYKAEAAAYRLSRLLQLSHVPPTVVRQLGRQTGSLQYWVEGVQPFHDVEKRIPGAAKFTKDYSRMRVFDRLLHNPDRNKYNFLVTPDGRLVFIDHSRALSFDSHSKSKVKEMPSTLDRRLLERLGELDLEMLQAEIGDLVAGYRIRALLKERDRILRLAEEDVAKRGKNILFD
ncbi:MAG: hypothetical protein AAF690_25125 [Acidobacteriota bacterium]